MTTKLNDFAISLVLFMKHKYVKNKLILEPDILYLYIPGYLLVFMYSKRVFISLSLEKIKSLRTQPLSSAII